MSGNFQSLWVYIIATLTGGIAAALVHKYALANTVAPTVEPAGEASAGDRSLKTGDNS